jgi:hypothetical protein
MYGVGAARTAPAVETGGALVAEEACVAEVRTEVVPDAEVLTPDEGDTAEGLLTGGPLTEGPLTGGTPVSAGGPGGATVAVLTGGPLVGGVAIESTEVAGGAGGAGGDAS